MADGRTTLTKPMADLLAPGEELLGGCKSAGMNGALKSAVAGAGGLVGGVVGSAIPGSAPAGGYAAIVPQDKVFWIGATNRRLVFFGVGALTSAPKKFRGETPLEAIESVTVTPRKISRRLTLAFSDGSSTAVDLYRANSPDQLQQALQQVLPGRVFEQS